MPFLAAVPLTNVALYCTVLFLYWQTSKDKFNVVIQYFGRPSEVPEPVYERLLQDRAAENSKQWRTVFVGVIMAQ